MVNEKNVKKAEERPETMWMIVIVSWWQVSHFFLQKTAKVLQSISLSFLINIH